MAKETIQINGTLYDKHTGMPLRHVDTPTAKARTHAHSVHQATQRSTTLNRNYVKKAALQPQTVRAAQIAPAAESVNVAVRTAATKRSPMIQKYAKHPVPAAKPAAEPIAPPVAHPVEQRAHHLHQQKQAPKRQAQPAQKTTKPSDVIKAEAIQQALDAAPSHHQRAPRRPKSSAKRTHKQQFSRFVSFASAGAALLLIAGYFTYVNMPNLSVRVAAINAGVDANYPGYRPSGYSLSGPVAYNDGQVTMKFEGNGTSNDFTLTQTNSGWDSVAVLDNYVAPQADTDYMTITEGGLTIYSWGNGNAAWVNRGVLYTVEGDAPLTPDQVQRIASSV